MKVRRGVVLGWAFSCLATSGLAGCGPAPSNEAATTASEPATIASLASNASKPATTVAPAATAAEPVAAAKAGSRTAALPMPLGYYAHGSTCEGAMKLAHMGIVISAEYFHDIDADYPLLPVTDLGGGKFKLGEAADVARMTGPKTFVTEEGTQNERRFIWCADKAPDVH